MINFQTGTLLPVVFFLIVGNGTVHNAIAFGASPQSESGPDTDYCAEISHRKTFKVDFSAVVTAPAHTKILKVWLPIPPSDNVQQIADSQLSTFPVDVRPHIATEPLYGNQFAMFEFHHPQGAQVIRHRLTATVANLNWNVDAKQVKLPWQWPKDFDPYLRSHQVDQREDFKKLLGEFVSGSHCDAHGLFQAMNWIDQNMSYDHVDASLHADAFHAFEKRRGHCSDYHGLCAAFGRELGVPTRVTYGLSLFPKNSPSHCKLEAFLPPYGWVSFDLSETQKMVKAIVGDDSLSTGQKSRLAAAAKQRLFRGFRENSWLLVTRGTHYELAPRASRPVAVVRTIHAEADGVALPEPDPANVNQREFSWMTVHQYLTDEPVVHPFKDYSTLVPEND